MGRGIRAGKVPQSEKNLRKLERAVKYYADREERRMIDRARETLAEEVTQELAYRHNIDMIAVMLALRDEFGFGKGRLIRTMKRTMELAEQMIQDHVDVDEVLGVLADETGIREEDLVWTMETEAQPVEGG